MNANRSPEGEGQESHLVRFFRGQSPDSEGRYFSEILNWPNFNLEHFHDYIQWVFPLKERSMFNPHAPLLDEATIQAFNRDPLLQARLVDIFKRILAFYGFDYKEEGGRVVISPAANWPERKKEWLNPYNHNFLRLTRIMLSLRWLGLPDQAQAFYNALSQIYHSPEGKVIGEETFGYWTRAVTEQ